VNNNDNVKENLDNINTNFEFDIDMQKLRVEVLKKFDEYRNTMNFMVGDAPIGILCLNPIVEKILLDNGCSRVYDLFNLDLVEIKGLGEIRIKQITARLDQFFSML